ncbi:hypothetical protein PR001_g29687 [Phytophthora rubi]|uniref:Crinkler effector protein N-terminal domain-containing protein n=1 Tax=Phytophthora rubi TaxID=129364 RepID=A0A6A3H080_9STRA|nr:hypothetical protein PR001_g29687 [Phytophthora rubi]
MARKWFQLVGEDGRTLTSATSVDVGFEDVDTFRKAVFVEVSRALPANVIASGLTVFANQATYGAKLALEEDAPIGSFGGSKKDALVVQVPTQRPVAGPTLSQQSFVWKAPKSLVGSTGAKWDFQNSLNIGSLSYAIGQHYQAWTQGKTDKRSHPLFVCLDGPGTGKSRLLDEFPDVLQRQVGAQGTPAMKQLLQKAYTFKVTFENGTTDNHGISDPSKMIGTRMLYQLQNSVDWAIFRGNSDNQVFPGEVLTMLSEITGTDLDKICDEGLLSRDSSV